MTADLDLSPEAVERLLSLPRLYLDHEGDLCCERTGDNLVACPAVGDQPTSGLLNPDMWEAIPQFQTLARTLAAENTRLRAERDEQRERAEEAEQPAHQGRPVAGDHRDLAGLDLVIGHRRPDAPAQLVAIVFE